MNTFSFCVLVEVGSQVRGEEVAAPGCPVGVVEAGSSAFSTGRRGRNVDPFDSAKPYPSARG
jgi:hypothetical protein